MTDPVADDLHAWAEEIRTTDPAFADACTAAALADIVAQRNPRTVLQNQIKTKTTTRDQIKAAAQTSEATLAGYVGQTITLTATTVTGQATVTGSFAAAQAAEGGWIQGTGLQAGTLVTGWDTGTLTLSKPATASGTVTVTIQTGSLAVQDATIADLTAQKNALSAELATISDGGAILAAISDGRTALEAAGHYLAPRTIARDGATDQTSAIATWLGTVPDGSGPFAPNYAHSWRSSTYRVDGTITLTARNNLRWDHHGSVLTAGITGSATRAHITLDRCTQVRIIRRNIKGSLPAGVPVFSSTYSGQHGVQILGGSNIVLDRGDIDAVYGSAVRCAPDGDGVLPNVVRVIGAGSVGRCGNHALAVAGCNNLEWTTVAMGATGRDTIAVSPASGIVCDGVNLHDFRITGAITDPSKFTVSARSAGKVNNFTIDGVTADAAHGPLTSDIAATTSGTPHTNVTITDNTGAGSLLNNARSAWLVANATNLIFTGNTQSFAQSAGANVMYGLKGTTIGGTVTVSGNTFTNAVDQALVNGSALPGRAGTLTISSPTALGPFAPGVSLGAGVTFTAQHSAGGEVWSHSTPTGGTALPTGMTFSSAGVLAGTPGSGTAGSYTHRFSVTDSLNQTAYVDLTFRIAADLAITTTSLGPFVKGTASTDNLTATGGTGAKHWSVQGSPALPAAFTLDDDGTLHYDGTGTASTTNVTFKATDELTPTPDTDTQTIAVQIATAATVFKPYITPVDRTWVGLSGAKGETVWADMLAKGIPLRIVRVPIEGATVNPSKDSWNWSGVDNRVSKALALGLEVNLMPTYFPKWLVGSNSHAVPGDATFADVVAWWAEFLGRVADRYCRGGSDNPSFIKTGAYVTHIEQQNEPNMDVYFHVTDGAAPMDHYADLVAAGYDAAKDVTGYCTVGCGASGVHTINDSFGAALTKMLARWKATGYKQHKRGWTDKPVDALYAHPYCGGRLGSTGQNMPYLDCKNNATYNAFANWVPIMANVAKAAGLGACRIHGTEFGGGHMPDATTGYGRHGNNPKGPGGGAGDSNTGAVGSNGGNPERKIASEPEMYRHVRNGCRAWGGLDAWPTGSNLTPFNGDPDDQLGALHFFAGIDIDTTDNNGVPTFSWESHYGLYTDATPPVPKRLTGTSNDAWDALIELA